MLEMYWTLFIVGLILAIFIIVIGDLIGGLLDGLLDFLSLKESGFIHPITFVGFLISLGGAGILMTKGTNLSTVIVFIITLLITLITCILLYFALVRPMRNAENSTSYSIQDLVGKIGEVSVTIPVEGFGEVIVRAGAGRVNEIASSLDSIEIKSGLRVIIVDVEDGIVRVSPFDPDPYKS